MNNDEIERLINTICENKDDLNMEEDEEMKIKHHWRE